MPNGPHYEFPDLIESNTYWNAPGIDAHAWLTAHGANNGFGAPEVLNSLGKLGMSQGKHLIQVFAPGGTWTRSFDLSSNVSVATDIYGSTPFAVWGNLNIYNDTCGVWIMAHVDPTYRRELIDGVPARMPNTLGVQGEMYGDTLVPYGSQSIGYTALPTGPWGQNSYFHWYSNMMGNWNEGDWNPAPLPALSVIYVNPPASAGATEHVHFG